MQTKPFCDVPPVQVYSNPCVVLSESCKVQFGSQLSQQTEVWNCQASQRVNIARDISALVYSKLVNISPLWWSRMIFSLLQMMSFAVARQHCLHSPMGPTHHAGWKAHKCYLQPDICNLAGQQKCFQDLESSSRLSAHTNTESAGWYA